jgi:hypothetical protein
LSSATYPPFGEGVIIERITAMTTPNIQKGIIMEPHRTSIEACQAPNQYLCRSFGFGGPFPKLPDFRSWTPRERALLAFLLDTEGWRNASLH